MFVCTLYLACIRAALYATMAGLASVGLERFTEADFAQAPVVYAFGPPKSGISTLLTSLLVQTDRVWKLDGVVVISNRKTTPYMGNIIPERLITNQSLGTVLTKLIRAQHLNLAACKATGAAPPRLAIAVDDWFPKESRTQEEIASDIRLLASVNIMLIVGTSDLKKIASLVPTTASHVFATRSYIAADAKLLPKSLFLMCADADEFSENWSACAKYEFLVGLLRVDSAGDAGGPSSLLRRYASTCYVKDAASYSDVSAAWKGLAAADASAAAAAVAPLIPPYEIANLTFDDLNVAKLIMALSEKA